MISLALIIIILASSSIASFYDFPLENCRMESNFDIWSLSEREVETCDIGMHEKEVSSLTLTLMASSWIVGIIIMVYAFSIFGKPTVNVRHG